MEFKKIRRLEKTDQDYIKKIEISEYKGKSRPKLNSSEIQMKANDVKKLKITFTQGYSELSKVDNELITYKQFCEIIIKELEYDIEIINKICTHHKNNKGFVRKYSDMIKFFEDIENLLLNLNIEEKRERNWVEELNNYERRFVNTFNSIKIPDLDKNLEFYKDIKPLSKLVKEIKKTIFDYLEVISSHTLLCLKHNHRLYKRYFIIKKTIEKYVPLLKDKNKRDEFYNNLRNEGPLKNRNKNLNHILKKFCRQQNSFFDDFYECLKEIQVCLEEIKSIYDLEKHFRDTLLSHLKHYAEEYEKTYRIYESNNYYK
jgi:hypothetical protein